MVEPFETATPGIFYHGSPVRDLARIESEAQLGTGSNHGIYFTKNRTYAEGYAGPGGAVYSVLLKTKNPKHIAGPLPVAFVSAEDVEEYRGEGVDCLVSSLFRDLDEAGDFEETIVFDPTAVFMCGASGVTTKTAQLKRPKGAAAKKLAKHLVRETDFNRRFVDLGDKELTAERLLKQAEREIDFAGRVADLADEEAWAALMQGINSKVAEAHELAKHVARGARKLTADAERR